MVSGTVGRGMLPGFCGYCGFWKVLKVSFVLGFCGHVFEGIKYSRGYQVSRIVSFCTIFTTVWCLKIN